MLIVIYCALLIVFTCIWMKRHDKAIAQRDKLIRLCHAYKDLAEKIFDQYQEESDEREHNEYEWQQEQWLKNRLEELQEELENEKN